MYTYLFFSVLILLDILCEFVDLALKLLRQCSELVVVRRFDGKTALHILAEKTSEFDNSR